MDLVKELIDHRSGEYFREGPFSMLLGDRAIDVIPIAGAGHVDEPTIPLTGPGLYHAQSTDLNSDAGH